jgi:hypothetical protein
MKIRPVIWATALLIISATICILRINTRFSQASAQNANSFAQLTPQQSAAHELKKKQFREAFLNAREKKFKAQYNNGSRRQSLTLDQLPVEVREEAEKIAAQYREVIYPAILKFVAENNGRLPAHAGLIPAVPASFTEDKLYQGTGPVLRGRGSWSIGERWRLDGTLITRDVYSKDPPDAPHDVWAEYSEFETRSNLKLKFRIRGWDDGQVTFDDLDNSYFATIRRPKGIESIPGIAAPGQAGIPPYATQGFKRWFKKLEKERTEQSSRDDKPTNDQKSDSTNAGKPKLAGDKLPVQ